MLRINLLPIRQLKKRAKARNQIVAALVVFCGVLVILALAGLLQASRVSSLEAEKASKEKEKASYGAMVNQIAEMEKKKADLESKIKVINQLKTDSSLTVHVLDEVAKIIDHNRMWLTALDQKGNTLTLTGYALDNETIAQFMNELKDNSPYVTAVGLTNSSLSQVSGKDLKSFSLNCSVASPAAQQETPAEEGKQQ